jgi:hypothetical protein
MRYETYAGIAKFLGVDFCGEAGSGHENGYLSMDGEPHGKSPRLHWRERRVTRSGIRRFLMMASEKMETDNTTDPGWLRLWNRIEWARSMAVILRVKIPPELWAEDKARLQAKLVNALPSEQQEIDFKRALRWTRR